MLRALQRLSHAAERPGVWSPLGGVSAARVGAARGSLQAAAQVFSATPASGIGTPRCFTTTPVSAVAPPRKTSEEVHGKIDIDSVSSKAMRRTLQRKQQAEGALKPLPEEAQQQQQDAAQQQWLAQQAQEQQQQWSGQQTMSFGQLLKHNLVMGFGMTLGIILVFAVIRALFGGGGGQHHARPPHAAAPPQRQPEPVDMWGADSFKEDRHAHNDDPYASGAAYRGSSSTTRV